MIITLILNMSNEIFRNYNFQVKYSVFSGSMVAKSLIRTIYAPIKGIQPPLILETIDNLWKQKYLSIAVMKFI